MQMSTLSRRALLYAAGACAAGIALAGCSRQAPEAPKAAPAPAPVAAPAPPPPRVYVVGTDAAYAPFELQNEKGEIVGFSIDLMNAIADKGGFQVKFVNTPWEGIFNTLAQGDRDLLISSITITEERKQSMDFSDPYFDAQQLIAVPAKSKVGKFADLKKLKVGVQTGTTGDEVVTKLLGKTSTNVKRFESTPLALKELESGGVDAVVADNGVVINYVANNKNASFRTVADSAFAPEQYGIAVKKGNAEMLDKVNKGIAAIKSDGTYEKLFTQYFGAPVAGAQKAEAKK
jgi:polar amino acid transport system substrate-binding protein